jgi:hypothetical protein
VVVVKFLEAYLFYIDWVRKNPIKANPAKAGDAKLWVYRHESDQDCQAAEDHKTIPLCVFGLAYFFQAVLFGVVQMTHISKLMLIVFAAIVIASTTFAFASSKTLAPGMKGEGVGGISGYEVSNIAYHLNTDPTRIDSVLFTLDAFATTVKIKLNYSVSTWYACSPVTGNDWICQTDGATTQTADKLTVFAAGN